EVLGSVDSTASATVSNTGMPSTDCPALPGVTPATTLVPYALLRRAWKVPSFPVSPCTTTRVPWSIRMAMPPRSPAHPWLGLHRVLAGQLHRRPGRLEHRRRRNDPGVGGLLQDPPAFLRIRPVQADHDGDPRVHPL